MGSFAALAFVIVAIMWLGIVFGWPTAYDIEQDERIDERASVIEALQTQVSLMEVK